MPKCPCYRTERRVRKSDETHTHHQDAGTKIDVLLWCVHPNSPVSAEQAHEIGGIGLLKCGGDVGKCPLPPGIKPRQ